MNPLPMLAVAVLLVGYPTRASRETPKDHFQRGLAFFERVDLKQAKKEFEKARRAEPNWPEPIFYLGLCAHARNDVKKARRLYRETLDLFPTHLEARHWLKILEDGEKLKKAKRYLDTNRFDKLAEEVVKFVAQGGDVRSALDALTSRPDRLFYPSWVWREADRSRLGGLRKQFRSMQRRDLSDEMEEYYSGKKLLLIEETQLDPGQSERGRQESELGATALKPFCRRMLHLAERSAIVPMAPQKFQDCGFSVQFPRLLKTGIPRFSREAIERKIRGVVLLKGIVGADGKMIHMDVIRGLGYGLNEAAIETIRKTYVFAPARLNGKPVQMLAIVEVTFRLQ